jgi:hypothetical protein
LELLALTRPAPLSAKNPSVSLEGNCIDLSELVSEDYIPAIPFDPIGDYASLTNSYYYISKTAGGVITVGSCREEKEQTQRKSKF